MSSLRPECGLSTKPSATEPFLLRTLNRALAKRRGLAFGRLNGANGSHCAMGCFWAAEPGYSVTFSLIEQVAAVNDSVPKELGSSVRMRVVRNWVRNRMKSLGVAA
jgi:hypothetical protein